MQPLGVDSLLNARPPGVTVQDFAPAKCITSNDEVQVYIHVYIYIYIYIYPGSFRAGGLGQGPGPDSVHLVFLCFYCRLFVFF